MNTNMINQYILTIVVAAAITPLTHAQNVGAPVWSSIMLSGQEVQYAKYLNNSGTGMSKTETFSSAAPWNGSGSGVTSSSRPPYTYSYSNLDWSGGYLSDRGVCSGASGNLDNVNWSNWDPTTYPNWPPAYHKGSEFPVTPGSFPQAPVSEFNESRVENGILGLEFKGSFSGVATGPYAGAAIETVYAVDHPCITGHNEYGFFRNAAAYSDFGTMVFYYSDKTNCGSSAPYCYSNAGLTNTETVNSDYITITGKTSSTGPSSTSLALGTTYYFHAYLVTDPSYPASGHSPYLFRVEVLDTSAGLTSCSFDNGSTYGNCTIDMPIKPGVVWSGFSDLLHGEHDINVVAGITVDQTPNITSSPGLTVDEVKIGN